MAEDSNKKRERIFTLADEINESIEKKISVPLVEINKNIELMKPNRL